MENVLKNLLESDELDPQIRQALSEEWENKLNEERAKIREEVEAEVRGDLTRRFESDREKMVEAMDKFMTEAVNKELNEFAEDRRQVFAARAKLARQIRENKQQQAVLVKDSAKVLEAFCLKMLNKELKEFQTDKNALVEAKSGLKKQLTEERAALNQNTAERINKLEAFVIKKISEEIKEFETDKHALVEQRVRMAKEAKAKLDETRKAFVKRSAALVEKTLNESLTKEFNQFRDDIRLARQNHFGRKIFEAFAAEYMTSYLSEGSEVKKLQGLLEESKKQTEKALGKLSEQQSVIEGLGRKIKLSEEASKRSKLMSELLAPLGRENRAVMEEVLANVKTERLREAFQKHLPAVLNESKRDFPKKTLVESTTTNKKTVITGNREVSKTNTNEGTTAEVNNAEVFRLRALAGIK